MWEVFIPFGSALLGVIGTILIYWLDPKQKARRQLAPVVRDIEKWERKLDEALVKNDSDGLTVAASFITRLRKIQADLLSIIR